MNFQSDEKRMRDVEQEWYAMQGFKTDIKCHFYYDESNNCRKFWVRTNQKNLEKEFNVNPYEYYGAAEPPVRCGESHLSGLTEPPHFVY